MLNKFCFRFILFTIILLLITLIVERKNQAFPVFYNKEIKFHKEYDYKEEYLLYVADKNNLIFPLNVITLYNKDFIIDYYQEKIANDFDKRIYLTFALLTNYSNYLPKTVTTFIPKATKILNYHFQDQCLELNLSESFLTFYPQHEIDILKIITYTYTSIPGIKEIKLKCEDQVYKEKLTKSDFVLNLSLNNIYTELETYQVYYYTEVDNYLYLVQVTIIDTVSSSLKDKLNNLLIKQNTLPLISLVTENDIKNINLLAKNLAYYQLFLTYFDNNIFEIIDIDIKDINNYNCELY